MTENLLSSSNAVSLTEVGRLPWPLNEIQCGLIAPFDSLRFFRRHKGLLFTCVTIHLLGFAAFLWGMGEFALPWIQEVVLGGDAAPGTLSQTLFVGAAKVAVLTLGLFVFAIVAVPVLNVLASPFFDVIAQKAYEDFAVRTVPNPGWKYFFRSLGFEVLKLVLSFLLVLALLTSHFVALLVPIALVLSMWFFGWDHIDRTLGIRGIPLGRRIGFGIRHCLACTTLGAWMYVPLVSTLFSFTFAAAGAAAVARIEGRKKPPPTAPSSPKT